MILHTIFLIIQIIIFLYFVNQVFIQKFINFITIVGLLWSFGFIFFELYCLKLI